MPEPALTAFAMQEGGYDPALLEAGSRRELARQFGASTLLVPRLTSFPVPEISPAEIQRGEADRLGIVLGTGAGVPFLVALSVVDSRTGGTVAVAGTYLAPENREGTFGRARQVSVVRRFRDGARHLVGSLSYGQEE